MNLKELRNKIKNITDYNPEVQSYIDDLDSLINDSYSNIYTAKRWNFAQTKKNIDIFPDFTSDIINANVQDGVRAVSFSSDLSIFLENKIEWEGQIFQYEDRDYTIDQVTSAKGIRLREPFRGTSTVDATEWKIIHRHYNLPEDLVEILNITHTDTPVSGAGTIDGKKASLAPRRAEDVNLKYDKTAEHADAYIMLEPVNVEAAMKFGTATIDETPVDNGFVAGQYWEFTWAFLWDGVVGPLSEPIVVQGDAGEQGMYPIYKLPLETWDDRPAQATTYDPLHDVYTTPFEGYQKVLFYNSNFDHNTGERKGLPLWRMVRDAGSSKTREDWKPYIVADDDLLAVIDDAAMVAPGTKRYIEIDGQHQRFRPYPRPQGFDKQYTDATISMGDDVYPRDFRQWVMRYLSKPTPLCSNTDSPKMPYEFHQLIVYSVLFEVFTKGNNSSMAMMYDKKIRDSVKVLERRYIDRTDVFWQRGQFGITHNGIFMDTDSFRKLN